MSTPAPRDPSCIFCKIIHGEIPSARVYEDEDLICIKDLHPQAKVHLLVIPKTHVASLEAAFPAAAAGAQELLGRMFAAATKIARDQQLLPGGFRSVINTGLQGGQSVFHLHLHILGGESLRGNFG